MVLRVRQTDRVHLCKRSGKGKQVIIHKLLVPVDLKKIKDLQQLLALLQEVEDYAAANEDGEPGDDEDAVPAPA